MKIIQVYREAGTGKFSAYCLHCSTGLTNSVPLIAAINAAAEHNDTHHEFTMEIIVCRCPECAKAINAAFLGN